MIEKKLEYISMVNLSKSSKSQRFLGILIGEKRMEKNKLIVLPKYRHYKKRELTLPVIVTRQWPLHKKVACCSHGWTTLRHNEKHY